MDVQNRFFAYNSRTNRDLFKMLMTFFHFPHCRTLVTSAPAPGNAFVLSVETSDSSRRVIRDSVNESERERERERERAVYHMS